jgi:hypothetical protein
LVFHGHVYGLRWWLPHQVFLVGRLLPSSVNARQSVVYWSVSVFHTLGGNIGVYYCTTTYQSHRRCAYVGTLIGKFSVDFAPTSFMWQNDRQLTSNFLGLFWVGRTRKRSEMQPSVVVVCNS